MSIWKHKAKYKNLRDSFKSSYERDKRGERVFILSNGKRNITFESWQAAVKQGWYKLDGSK